MNVSFIELSAITVPLQGVTTYMNPCMYIVIERAKLFSLCNQGFFEERVQQ